MNNYDEIEFKYNAKDITLNAFHKFCTNYKHEKKIVFGSDTFYIKQIDLNQFCRHRYGNETNQLTYKQKTVEANSYIREEINVDLATSMTPVIVEQFLSKQGYYPGNTIDKYIVIYIYDKYVMAYYICYDSNMKELGRFIEIEIREDVELGNREDKFSYLTVLEKLCKTLGITKSDRISESLFEMYGIKKEL